MALPRLGGKNSGIGGIVSEVASLGVERVKDTLSNELGPDARALGGFAKGLLSSTAGAVVSGGKAVLSLTGKKPNKRDKKTKTEESNTNNGSSLFVNKQLALQSGLLKGIQAAVVDQSNKLNILNSIHIELRTLTGVTSRVWDVSKKQLSDTRAFQKKALETQRKSRFSDQVKNTDNNTIKEVFDSIKKPQGGGIGMGLFGNDNNSKNPIADMILPAIANNLPEIGAGALLLTQVKKLGSLFSKGAGAAAGGLGAMFMGKKGKVNTTPKTKTGAFNKAGKLKAKPGAGFANSIKAGGKSILSKAAKVGRAGGAIGGGLAVGGPILEAAKEFGNVPFSDFKEAGAATSAAYKRGGLLSGAMELLGGQETQDIIQRSSYGATKGLAKLATIGNDFGFGDGATRKAMLDKIEVSRNAYLTKRMHQAKQAADSTPSPVITTGAAGTGGNNTVVDNSTKTNTTIVTPSHSIDKKWRFSPYIGM